MGAVTEVKLCVSKAPTCVVPFSCFCCRCCAFDHIFVVADGSHDCRQYIGAAAIDQKTNQIELR